ncbi:Arm DNA-binding domain-containing protein, partial [Halopseudomonas aestusnigri]|uniref:Arm DNA-binding domain-containing protein n=1 Tax=Halopseudomonas aestusnigri TaxID=857252 RepID=UPI0030C698A8
MGNLTAKTVEKLIKEGTSKMHSDGDGLYLRVKSSGSASWLFRYRTGGKLRDMGLGAYPEVTLAEARDLATDARKLAKTGTDPIEERQRLREAAEAAQRLRIPANVTGHSGDRDRFAHGLHAGTG